MIYQLGSFCERGDSGGDYGVMVVPDNDAY
jgi:hypothetical protein